jgi:hypothetical protein
MSSTTAFTIDSQVNYQKILVPHDGSMMSDKALSHAAYLSKISGAEIIVLNIIEDVVIPPSIKYIIIRCSFLIQNVESDRTIEPP